MAGRPLLVRVLERVRPARIDALAVATSTLGADDAVAALAASVGAGCVRGSETDVLDRYRVAAHRLDADVVVRLTADNPFVDADVVSLVVARHVETDDRPDYTCTAPQSFPYGISVEAIERSTLEAAAAAASTPEDREHVTTYIRSHPDRFRLAAVETEPDAAAARLTVDTEDDLVVARRIFAHFAGRQFGWREAAALLLAHPEWRGGGVA